MTSKYDRPSVNLFDLAGMVQSITSQRRSGVMTARYGKESKEERTLRFVNGNLVALSGGLSSTFAKALVWSEVVSPEQLSACLATLGKSFRPEHLAQTVVARNIANKDGLLDAMDCYVEEGFSELVSIADPRLSFTMDVPADPWADLQVAMGVSVSPGSLLLEALRRQDELKTIAQHVPDTWDVLVLDAGLSIPSDLHPDAVRILAGWRDGLIAGSLFERSLLPPFRSTTALALLRRLGLVRPATPAELVVYADAAHAHGRHKDAYGLYRRALAVGVDSPRIHLHLAELAERFGDNAAAADSYMAACSHLTDPGGAVVALRSALRLGTNREAPLTQLLAIYRQMNESEEAIRILHDLAQLYEEKSDLDQAAKAVRQAQELGADAVHSALTLARLAASEGDQEQAALQLELAAHAAQYGKRNTEAVAAWKELLAIVPGRCEYARECAELLANLDQPDEAIAILRNNLLNAVGASEDALVPVYELLAKLSPGDTSAHDWLAMTYERRRDRAGATQQLHHIAAAQEKSGNDGALAATLERIVELGGPDVPTLRRLAGVRARLGQNVLAGDTWCRAVDAALAVGQIKEARALCETARAACPASLALGIREAQIANRDGDRIAAQIAYRAAADLARGSGELAVARDVLMQIRRLRPDDALVRVEIAEVAQRLGDPDLDRIYRDVVHSSARTTNHGLALEFARRRVALSSGPGFEARNELVELLRRMGDHAGELSEGRELLNQLLEHGEFERALELLQRLVASNSRNADLVLQLAEIFAALSDERQAQRFYRHAICLLQLETRVAEAKRVLDVLADFASDDEAISIARVQLDKGQAVDWESIRLSLSQNQRRRLADEIGSGRHEIGSFKDSPTGVVPTIT